VAKKFPRHWENAPEPVLALSIGRQCSPRKRAFGHDPESGKPACGETRGSRLPTAEMGLMVEPTPARPMRNVSWA
jgi:hypothetical protein